MICKHDTGQGHHNPSDPQSTTSVDCKLATGKDVSFSSKTMRNEDTTDIMVELAIMRHPNQLRSSIPESTLHQISKMVMKEAVEDKKVELIRSSTKIPAKDVDGLCLINTSDLYGLINDCINKYIDYNIVQGVVNDMIDNTIVPTMVDSSNKVTAASKLGKTKPIIVHKNNHGNTKLTNTELKSNNILGTNIAEEKEG